MYNVLLSSLIMRELLWGAVLLSAPYYNERPIGTSSPVSKFNTYRTSFQNKNKVLILPPHAVFTNKIRRTTLKAVVCMYLYLYCLLPCESFLLKWKDEDPFHI